ARVRPVAATVDPRQLPSPRAHQAPPAPSDRGIATFQFAAAAAERGTPIPETGLRDSADRRSYRHPALPRAGAASSAPEDAPVAAAITWNSASRRISAIRRRSCE